MMGYFVVSWIMELAFVVSIILVIHYICKYLDSVSMLGVSGFQFRNVSSGSHIITVQGASVITPHLLESVILEIPEFTVAADISGSTITLLINPDTDAAFRCRLDDNDHVAC